MGLFNKKKKQLNNRQKGGVFNPTKTEVYSKEYTNLFEALNGEIGSNSQDVKIITAKYPDREVVFYTNCDDVVNILDPTFKFSLGDRIYWTVDLTEEEEEAIIKNSGTNDLYNYAELIKLIKDDDQEEVNIIFNKMVTANLLELFNNFNKDVSVISEIIYDPDRIEEIRNLKFYNLNVDNLTKQVTNLINRTEEFLVSLGIDKVNSEDVTFTLLDNTDDLRLYKDSERLILGAVENEATLQDVRDVSDGFAWDTDILESISDLKDRGIIELNYPGKITFALPELDSEDEIEIEEAPEENNDFSMEMFKLKLLSYVDDFDVYDNLEKEKFINRINANAELEEEVDALTTEIEDIKSEYFKNRKEYEDKKADRVFEEGDETQKEIYDIDQLSDTLFLQNDSNEKFELLSDLEKRRLRFNDERKLLLNELLELANDQESLTLDKFKDLVNYRIKEINETQDVTRELVDEDLKKMEEETVEEMFIEDETISTTEEDLNESEEALEELFYQGITSFNQEVLEDEEEIAEKTETSESITVIENIDKPLETVVEDVEVDESLENAPLNEVPLEVLEEAFLENALREQKATELKDNAELEDLLDEFPVEVTEKDELEENEPKIIEEVEKDLSNTLIFKKLAEKYNLFQV